MSRGGQPKDLGSLLGDVAGERNWQHRIGLHQVFLFWDELVGRELGRRAQPEVIRGRTLWIEVSDSIWMQQLQFEKIGLLRRINKRLARYFADHCPGISSPELLADIRFRLRKHAPAPEKKAKPQKEAVIDKEGLARLESDLQSIDDPQIRSSIKKLWLATARRGVSG